MHTWLLLWLGSAALKEEEEEGEGSLVLSNSLLTTTIRLIDRTEEYCVSIACCILRSKIPARISEMCSNKKSARAKQQVDYPSIHFFAGFWCSHLLFFSTTSSWILLFCSCMDGRIPPAFVTKQLKRSVDILSCILAQLIRRFSRRQAPSRLRPNLPMRQSLVVFDCNFSKHR